MEKLNNQIVGNIGLFYVCYRLSKRGWNCLPTVRNARGVDLVIYSRDAKKSHTIQVKSLSKRNPVPFGSSPQLIAEFLIIVVNALGENPEVFIMRPDDIKEKIHKRERNGKISYWLEYKDYREYKEKWEIIS